MSQGTLYSEDTIHDFLYIPTIVSRTSDYLEAGFLGFESLLWDINGLGEISVVYCTVYL